jgi:hypothetical protein
MFTIDDFPFPKGDPDAIKLMTIMANLYKERDSAVRLVALFGIDEIKIIPNLSPLDLWDFLLGELAKMDKVRECVQAARDAHSDNTYVSFLDKLLSAPRTRFEVSGDFDPWEYLGLFDRTIESDLLSQMLFPFDSPPPLPPIVIGVLAERADEHNYFVRQVSAGILDRFLGKTGASLENDLLDWSPDPRVTAEFEIRKIAKKKFVNGRDEIDKVVAQLGPAVAGRTTILALSTENLRQQGVSEKLTEYLAFWSKFGTHAPPPVLCIVVVRWDDAHFSPAEAEPLLTKVFDQVSGGLTVVKPVTLSLCEVGNFDGWQNALTGNGRKINQVKYEQFKNLFKATFRLGELKERLLLPEGRIYI